MKTKLFTIAVICTATLLMSNKSCSTADEHIATEQEINEGWEQSVEDFDNSTEINTCTFELERVEGTWMEEYAKDKMREEGPQENYTFEAKILLMRAPGDVVKYMIAIGGGYGEIYGGAYDLLSCEGEYETETWVEDTEEYGYEVVDNFTLFVEADEL